MSDYRRFIAYLYEYPNNRKGGCCGFVRVESQNGFCRMDFRSNRRRFRRRPQSRSTDLSAGQGGCTAFRSKSPCGALFYEWKTLHALRCHWADGCHARQAWRSDPALPPDRRHRHPVGRSSDSAGVFLAHAPAGAQNIRRQWYQTDRRENCRNTRTSGSRRTCAVPAIIRRFKAQFDELSTEFSSNSELYPQNSNPESTVSTESTSTDTVNTVPADRITQSSANTLYPASAESVKTAESYPSANPEPPQPIPDSTAQPLHMTSADFSRRSSRAAVPGCSLSPASGPVPGSIRSQMMILTDCLRLSLDDLPQLRAAGLSVDANRFVLHGSSSYRHLLLARNRDQQELWYFRRPRRLHAE